MSSVDWWWSSCHHSGGRPDTTMVCSMWPVSDLVVACHTSLWCRYCLHVQTVSETDLGTTDIVVEKVLCFGQCILQESNGGKSGWKQRLYFTTGNKWGKMSYYKDGVNASFCPGSSKRYKMSWKIVIYYTQRGSIIPPSSVLLKENTALPCNFFWWVFRDSKINCCLNTSKRKFLSEFYQVYTKTTSVTIRSLFSDLKFFLLWTWYPTLINSTKIAAWFAHKSYIVNSSGYLK